VRAEEALFRLADRQHGVVALEQAVACGVTDAQIRHLLKTGRLMPVHRAVYRVPGSTRSLEQQAFAACLRAGPSAVASFEIAGGIWGIMEPADGVVDVTVPAERRLKASGLRVHRSRLLRPIDRTTKGVVPVTTPARTLVDLAGWLPEDRLTDASDAAFKKGLIDPRRLVAYLDDGRVQRMRNSHVLLGIANDRLLHGTPESVLEDKAIRVLRRYGLPEPQRQYETMVRGRRVRFDLCYEEKRLVIELSGRGPHWGREVWQSDHDRHNATELTGWKRLEFTWFDITQRELWFVLNVADGLGLRPSRWITNRPKPGR
jgi:hypothetical protein